MIVPDEIRKCVGFVGYAGTSGKASLAGTAFFLSRSAFEDDGVGPAFVYLVTAKHVIDKITSKGIDEILIRLNQTGGPARWTRSHISQWHFHPTDKSVDVAVLTIQNLEGLDCALFSLKSAATAQIIQHEGIGLGDEIFMAGLFVSHYGKKRNIPIVRVGNIAAMPEEKIESQFGPIDGYLVEVRSLGGLSGSPVFVHLGLFRHKDGELLASLNPEGRFFFLGLMQGHWPTDDAEAKQRVNTGIGIVVPADKILEVINQPKLLAMEEDAKKKHENSNMAVMDAVEDPTEDGTFSREDFESALKKASRKSKPRPE